jgi:hypothetical protein
MTIDSAGVSGKGNRINTRRLQDEKASILAASTLLGRPMSTGIDSTGVSGKENRSNTRC